MLVDHFVDVFRDDVVPFAIENYIVSVVNLDTEKTDVPVVGIRNGRPMSQPTSSQH